MKALKIIGLVILALWMVFMTLQVVYMGRLVRETCTYAQTASHISMFDGCR